MKEYKIFFAQQSLTDIEEAVNYYNEQVWGLGNKFLTDFNKAYKSIESNPYFSSVKYNNIRCAALRRFPFAIHYEIIESENRIIILAVFNTWKEPFW